MSIHRRLIFLGGANDYGSDTEDNLAVAGNKNQSADDNQSDDDSLLEECKALITEAADRALKRSLSKQEDAGQITDLDASSLNDVVEQVEVVEQRKSSFVSSVEDVRVNCNPSGENDSGRGAEQKTVVIESLDSENKEVDKLTEVEDRDSCFKDSGLELNHVEESENKDSSENKDVIEVEREVVESMKDNTDKGVAEAQGKKLEKKSSKGSLFANMFKFSKKKVKTDNGSKVVNGKTESPSPVEIESTSKSSASINGTSDGVAEVKRLDSLDSGIGVEKAAEQQVETVEYAVVQKKKNAVTETKPECSDILESPTEGEPVEEPLYINGDKTDEDFVYINERAIDTEGVNKHESPSISEEKAEAALDQCTQAGEEGVNGEKKAGDVERHSSVSSDSGTGLETKHSPVTEQPEKAKLKKKTWSFQFGRKKSATREVENSAVFMDPNASSPKEQKKPRWRLGKFSFRRSTTDISASTPNLHNSDIPEESEDVPASPDGKQKKKSKIKFPKLKKEKRKNSQTGQEEMVVEKRSASLTDLGVENNSPRSRKSKSV